MQETQISSLGGKDPLEEGMATPSSILAWRIPRTEEPGRPWPRGSKGVQQNWATNAFTFQEIYTASKVSMGFTPHICSWSLPPALPFFSHPNATHFPAHPRAFACDLASVCCQLTYPTPSESNSVITALREVFLMSLAKRELPVRILPITTPLSLAVMSVTIAKVWNSISLIKSAPWGWASHWSSTPVPRTVHTMPDI